MLKLGVDKNGRELIRVNSTDIVNLVIEQHALGPFAGKNDRIHLAKNWMKRFQPDECGLLIDRACNAPTSSAEESLKRKRELSQGSNNSRSTTTSSGGGHNQNTTPTQDKSHQGNAYKGNNVSTTGGNSSTAGPSNRATPLIAAFWRCTKCRIDNQKRHFFCSGCRQQVDFDKNPSFTSTPASKASRGGARGGRGYSKKK